MDRFEEIFQLEKLLLNSEHRHQIKKYYIS